MRLFHGTSSYLLIEIMKKKQLEVNYDYVSEDTQTLNAFLEEVTGCDLRAFAIYLSKDKEYIVHNYDYDFSININDLDKELLYVGSFDIINNVFERMMSGEDKEARYFAKKYEEKFIPFSEYDENIFEDMPEFLYFGEIELSDEQISHCSVVSDDYQKKYA